MVLLAAKKTCELYFQKIFITAIDRSKGEASSHLNLNSIGSLSLELTLFMWAIPEYCVVGTQFIITMTMKPHRIFARQCPHISVLKRPFFKSIESSAAIDTRSGYIVITSSSFKFSTWACVGGKIVSNFPFARLIFACVLEHMPLVENSWFIITNELIAKFCSLSSLMIFHGSPSEVGESNLNQNLVNLMKITAIFVERQTN